MFSDISLIFGTGLRHVQIFLRQLWKLQLEHCFQCIFNLCKPWNMIIYLMGQIQQQNIIALVLSQTHIHHNHKSKDWNYKNKEIQEGLLSLSAENET